MKEQTLIGGKTLNEIANMPMLETRKFMHQHGHDWFGKYDPKRDIKGTEKEKLYSVSVEYTVKKYRVLTIEVEAKNEAEAEEKALKDVYDEVDVEIEEDADEIEVIGVNKEEGKTFSVVLSFTEKCYRNCDVQVFAKTEEEAEELAIKQLRKEECDLSSDDVEVNGVEEIER